MDVRRLIIALLAALLLSAGAIWVLSRFYQQPGKSANAIKDIVAAAKPIPAGSALKKEDLKPIKWPQNLPLSGTIAKPEDIVDRVVLYPLDADEPILEHDLAVAGAGIGLTAKIRPDMRAVSVRSNEVVGVAGFLFPGSHVDVLATVRPAGNESPLTQTILQNVEVITAGQKIQPDPQGKPETVNVVTLLLSPEDSEKLLLAETQASIQFVLRNGSDTKQVDVPPVNMDELLAGPNAKKPAVAPKVMVARRPRAEKPKEGAASRAPEYYKVEVISGDKRSETTFK